MQSAAITAGKCTKKKEAMWSPPYILLLLFFLTVQHVKAESAEAAAKMLEEMQVKNQQMMEQNEESHQEHVKQLPEKMESERTRLMAEQERTLALKLAVFSCITWMCFSLSFLSTRPDLICGNNTKPRRTLLPHLPFQSLSACLTWPLLTPGY